MGDDTAQLQLTAYLLSILVQHDRGISSYRPTSHPAGMGD